MFTSSREVAADIGALVRKLRPKAGYFNYIQESTDGIMSESNTALARPLPLWPYSASDRVNRARNSQPGKMSVNLNMQFVDFWWRFATVPAGEIALRSWQNIAHDGALTFEVNGTLDQQDRQALETAKPIFQWAAANQQHLSGLRNGARASARRTLALTIPVAASSVCSRKSTSLSRFPITWTGTQTPFDLVIATNWAARPRALCRAGRLFVDCRRAPTRVSSPRESDRRRRKGLCPRPQPRRYSLPWPTPTCSCWTDRSPLSKAMGRTRFRWCRRP
jgi:hypothetical protein